MTVLGLPLWDCGRISLKMMGLDENFKNVPEGGYDARGSNGDDSGGVWQVVNRSKRLRKSTGGTFEPISESETVCKISKEQFKAMSVDDKLVSMFDMMTGFTSLNKRVQNIEHNIESMLLQNDETNRRMKYLEYKSIDLESRSRRNNLVFRGLLEVLNYENCEEIVTNFICDHLDLNGDSMCIQRAHRIGSVKTGRIRQRGARNALQGERERHRPIIACFRDYKDVEAILSNGRLLQGKPFGISRDYPKEIIAARSRLWPEYNSLKSKYPVDKITIAFPAKLIWGGRVKRDEFPDWVSIMKGGSGDRDQPKLSMQAPDRRMRVPQPSAFQQAQTDLQPRPQQQQSSPGTPGPNHQAEPQREARNLNTPETEPPNGTSDDMVIDSEHSDQSDTEQPDTYSQAMERLRQTQDRMEQPRDDETDLHTAGNSDEPDPINV